MKIFAKGWSYGKDGPGHRRIYYLKGCNLHCRWCASPESISFADELLFYPDRSAEDLSYLCPAGAIDGKTLDRGKCAACSARNCRKYRHRALEWAGEEISPDQIIEEVLDARENWGNFAGVTFGGGEPSLQSHNGLLDTLDYLRRLEIHTAVESNAAAENFKDLVPAADLIITDLKSGSGENFRSITGGDLKIVNGNHLFAVQFAGQLLIRIPVITTLNDSPAELTAMAENLSVLHEKRLHYAGEELQVELLKLHHFGQAKYAALGKDYPAAGLPEVPEETINFMEKLLTNCGIRLVKS